MANRCQTGNHGSGRCGGTRSSGSTGRFSFISLYASAGVIFETFSGSDERGRFSKGDTRAEFGLCFVLDVSFKQVYIAQVDLVE